MTSIKGEMCPFMSGPIVLPTGSGVDYPTVREAVCMRENCVMWQTYGPNQDDMFALGMCVLKWAALALIKASTLHEDPRWRPQ